jgi:hypothetical protein
MHAGFDGQGGGCVVGGTQAEGGGLRVCVCNGGRAVREKGRNKKKEGGGGGCDGLATHTHSDGAQRTSWRHDPAVHQADAGQIKEGDLVRELKGARVGEADVDLGVCATGVGERVERCFWDENDGVDSPHGPESWNASVASDTGVSPAPPLSPRP